MVGHPLEVLQVLVARAVAVGVRVVVAEQVGVAATGGVDPRPGVPVLVPGTADLRVLLDHHERDAGALQLHRDVQTRDAGADHRDLEAVALVWGLVLPPANAPSPAIERRLLQPDVELLLGDLMTSGEREARAKACSWAELDPAGAAVAVLLEERRGLGPQRVSVRLVRHVAPGPELRGRPGLHVDDVSIARQLVEQPPEDHRLGMANRVLDGRITGRQQFRLLCHRHSPGSLFTRSRSPDGHASQSERSKHDLDVEIILSRRSVAQLLGSPLLAWGRPRSLASGLLPLMASRFDRTTTTTRSRATISASRTNSRRSGRGRPACRQAGLLASRTSRADTSSFVTDHELSLEGGPGFPQPPGNLGRRAAVAVDVIERPE